MKPAGRAELEKGRERIWPPFLLAFFFLAFISRYLIYFYDVVLP